MYHLGAKEERVMESWTTTTSLPLSGAKGLPLSAAKEHSDRGRPDVGVPGDQAGVWNGELEAGSPIIASLFDEPVSAARRQGRRKKGNFSGKQSH